MWELPDSDGPCAWLCGTRCPGREKKDRHCGGAFNHLCCSAASYHTFSQAQSLSAEFGRGIPHASNWTPSSPFIPDHTSHVSATRGGRDSASNKQLHGRSTRRMRFVSMATPSWSDTGSSQRAHLW